MARAKKEIASLATAIFKILLQSYPEAKCSLDYEDPFQLLVSTILSAQCTDERVNAVTPNLFNKFPTALAMSKASLSELEGLIRSTGFFRNKSLSLQAASHIIVEDHGGKVPNSMEELVKIRGIGRKTANVVLGNAFHTPGMVVDTHVGRLSRRMGFTSSHDPEKIEAELMKIFPKKHWVLLSHLLIAHGRAVCSARRARCEECPVSHLCPKLGVKS